MYKRQYYDYYQPEAYVPSSDTYIEKDSSVNDEIDKLRHSCLLYTSIKQTWEEALPGLKVEEKFVTFKQRLEDTKNQNFDVALVLWGGD